MFHLLRTPVFVHFWSIRTQLSIRFLGSTALFHTERQFGLVDRIELACAFILTTLVLLNEYR